MIRTHFKYSFNSKNSLTRVKSSSIKTSLNQTRYLWKEIKIKSIGKRIFSQFPSINVSSEENEKKAVKTQIPLPTVFSVPTFQFPRPFHPIPGSSEFAHKYSVYQGIFPF